MDLQPQPLQKRPKQCWRENKRLIPYGVAVTVTLYLCTALCNGMIMKAIKDEGLGVFMGKGIIEGLGLFWPRNSTGARKMFIFKKWIAR